jgi:CheY-like chemotaxis protein
MNTVDQEKRTVLRNLLLNYFGKGGAKIFEARKAVCSLDGPNAVRENVLLVDDEHSFLERVSSILGKHGFDCICTTSVEQAKNVLYSRSDIILIISDLHMPQQDGFCLLEFLRSNLRFRHIPVVVSSALAFGSCVARALKLGARDYVAKPLVEEVLVSRVRKVLAPGRGTILSITDDDLIMQMLTRMLKRGGYLTLEAANGAEAGSVLQSHRVSLIISELVLGDMTGLDLLSLVSERFLDIPLLFLSDVHVHLSEEDVISAGAYGLVRRPLSNSEILHKVASLNIKP